MNIVLHAAGIVAVLFVSIILGYLTSGIWKVMKIRIGSPLLMVAVLFGFTGSTASWLMLLLLSAIVLSVWAMIRAIHRRWMLNRIAYAEEQLDTAWACLYAIYWLYIGGQRSFPYTWLEQHWHMKLEAAIVTSINAGVLFVFFLASISAMKRPYRRLQKWRSTRSMTQRERLVQVVAGRAAAGDQKLKAYAESLIDRLIERKRIIPIIQNGQRYVIDARTDPERVAKLQESSGISPAHRTDSHSAINAVMNARAPEHLVPERDRMIALHRQSFSAHPAAKYDRDVRNAYTMVLFHSLRSVVEAAWTAPAVDSLLRQYVSMLGLASEEEDPVWFRGPTKNEAAIDQAFRAVRQLRWRREGSYKFRLESLKYAVYADIAFTAAALNGNGMREVQAADISYRLGLSEKKRRLIEAYCLTLATGSEKDVQSLLVSRDSSKLMRRMGFIVTRRAASDSIRRKKRSRIAVVATMSAGKSTFINALLGDNLVPSKQQACTAKVTTLAGTILTDVQPIGRAKLSDGSLVYSGLVGTDNLAEWNDLEEVTEVYVEGRFDGIAIDSAVPVLYDTPGTNYSQDRTHQEITYRFLDNAGYDSLVYLVNAEYIGSTDDKVLLSKVSETLRGLKPKRPIVFLLNKLDKFDLEGDDDIEHSIRGLERFLIELGFEQPDIIPVSTYAAKLIRMAMKGLELTPKERKDLAAFYRLYVRDGVDFSAFARLAQPVPAAQDETVSASTVTVGDQVYEADQLMLALHRTGIRLVERRLMQWEIQ